MNIIRGEQITESATLTATKELFNCEKQDGGSLIDEECERAFQKGIELGEKSGFEKAVHEIKGWVELLQTITQKLIEQKTRLLDHLKPEVIEFAITVCERVIRKELSQPETMAKLIHSLITVCAPHLRQETVHIILAPDDLVMLESYLAHIHHDKRQIEAIHFRGDPLVKRGDCRIEMQAGLLNYSIARELADLQAKVLQR